MTDNEFMIAQLCFQDSLETFKRQCEEHDCDPLICVEECMMGVGIELSEM